MARKRISATVTDGTTNSPGNDMILNLQLAGAAFVSAATTKYATANGYVEVLGDLTGFDPSDPANNAPQQAFACNKPATIATFIYYGNIPAVGQHHIATLMRNGIATTIVLDVTSANDDGHGNAKLVYTTNSVNVVTGDLLAWKCAAGAGMNVMAGGISCTMQ